MCTCMQRTCALACTCIGVRTCCVHVLLCLSVTDLIINHLSVGHRILCASRRMQQTLLVRFGETLTDADAEGRGWSELLLRALAGGSGSGEQRPIAGSDATAVPESGRHATCVAGQPSAGRRRPPRQLDEQRALELQRQRQMQKQGRRNCARRYW